MRDKKFIKNKYKIRYKIVEANKDALDKNGYAYGCSSYAICEKQLKALLDGKVLSFFDGEYVTNIALTEKCIDFLIKMKDKRIDNG